MEKLEKLSHTIRIQTISLQAKLDSTDLIVGESHLDHKHQGIVFCHSNGMSSTVKAGNVQENPDRMQGNLDDEI